MANLNSENLSRRERQIMGIVYRLGQASAAEIHEALPDSPSYSAVRALLAVIEEKGYLKHTKEQRRFVYHPTIAPHRARNTALKQLMNTFFDNSAANLVESLLDPKDRNLSNDEIARIRELIDSHEPGGASTS